MVIDCTWSPDLAACDGGLSNLGARTIIERYNGVIPTASSYGHYLTVDGYCRANSTDLKVGTTISDYVDIPARDQDAVKSALLKRPLAIAMNIVEELVFYDSGIVDVESCTKNADEDLDHAINLVGYGTEDGKDYWLIRNSWSTYWGDEGYFKVVQGDRDCGVTTDAGYPIVDSKDKEVREEESVYV